MKHIFNAQPKVRAHKVESDMFQEPKFSRQMQPNFENCQLGVGRQG